jgi:GNAT superfamily N-acetyltransferase
VTLRLTLAKPRDAAPLSRVLANWRNETPWMPKTHTPQEDYAFLSFLIREAEVVTPRDLLGPHGFLARDGEEIQGLYLAPNVRGRGLGKALLDHAKARSDRLKLWTFQANGAARRFYAREGFVEVRLTDGAGNDEKLPDVRLVWTREDAA